MEASASYADFTYNAAGQLEGAQRSGTANDETYLYSAAYTTDNGNRDTVSSDTGSRDGAANQDWQIGTNNRLTDDGTFTYTYDDEGNRMSTVRKSGANSDCVGQRRLLCLSLVVVCAFSVSCRGQSPFTTYGSAVTWAERNGSVTYDDVAHDKPVIEVDLSDIEIVDSSDLTPTPTHVPNDTADVKDSDLAKLKQFPRLRVLNLYGRNSISDEGVEYLKDLGELQSLYLNGTRVSDKSVELITRLAKIEHLLLADTQITNAGLEMIAKRLPNLKSLSLSSCNIDDQGMQYVSGLHNLRWIDLSWTKISDDGMKNLGDLRNLEEIDLAGTQISDAGVAHLSTLSELNRLNIVWTSVGDVGIQSISGLTKLRTLAMGEVKVTDAGLVHLERLHNLNFVDLSGTSISDAGLVHLKKLDKLTFVGLSETKVTEQGVKSLRSHFPEATITFGK